MGLESSSSDTLRQAILDRIPNIEERFPRRSDDHHVVDFALQLFLPTARDPEKFLEREYGQALGKSGQQILEDFRKLLVETWDKLPEEERKPFGAVAPPVIERLRNPET